MYEFRLSKAKISEHDPSYEAGKRTRGLVLFYGERILPAFYHSCCGGRTVDGNKLFKLDYYYKPLKGVYCPWCRNSTPPRKPRGHRVGLCQKGAGAMAKKGYSWKQILDFYYPGAEIKRLWK